MIELRVATGIAIFCSIASAQLQEQSRQRPNEVELPIPISSARAVQPGTVEPLTPKQKLDRSVRNIISPQSLANRALIAGWDHMLRDPEEWGGNPDGYGKRLAASFGRMAVRESVQLSTDVAFGLDPRYDRCDCTGVLARTGHAWRRVIISRKDRGGETFAVSNFAGAYVTPLIADQWYPASKNNWNHKLTSGAPFLALRGVTNMLREFWPDVRRKYRIPFIKAD